jgi:E3 ubiquitin-protein ligase SHPRH
MVECTTAKAAEMALKLATQNRWCVTGTPVHRGLEDLQGLALFLGCAPWSDRTWCAQPLLPSLLLLCPVLCAQRSLSLTYHALLTSPAPTLTLILPPLTPPALTLVHAPLPLALACIPMCMHARVQHCAMPALHPPHRLPRPSPPACLRMSSHSPVRPFLAGCHRSWTRALLRPYLRGAAGAVSRAHAWVSEVFWRTQKGDVAHEISLPPQTEVTKRLHFAPVEAHFYRRQHDECAEAVRRVLSDLRRRKQTAMDDRMSVRVLQQMQKLRQACCHPQVGGSGVHSIHKKVLTMEEILTQLLERVKNECEEATRLVVAAEHGLAAVSILQAEDKAVAMQHYRNVLELEHKGQADGIRVDLLPRMHSRHNLAAVMREAECASVEVCGRQMSVEELATEEARIRNEFSAAQNTNVSACIERLGAAEDEVLRALGSRGEAGRMWYLEALELLASGGQAETVLDRVDHALSEGHKYSHATKQRREQDERSMAGKFTSVAGLKFLLNKRMDDLWEKRKQLLAQLRRLSAVPTQGEIDECGNCGDCKANYLKTGRRCRMCRLADEINAYKCAVFHHNAERDDKQSREYQERVGAGMLDGDRSGTKISLADGTAERKKSELESSLRVILGLLKRSGAGGAAGSSSAVSGDRARVLEQGRQQLEVWEKLGREYDRAQVLWRSQRERLEKLDELSMANMRMRYRNEDEEINEHTQFLLLEQGLEAEKRQALEFDRQDAKGRMLKARGQLKYLANLVQAQAARKRLAAAAAAEARRGAAGAGLAAGGGQGGGGEAAAETGVQGGAVGMDVDGDLGTCPVCTDEVGTSSEGVMLPCGHLLCYQCCRDLLKRSGGRHTKCPTCRNPCNNSELTYVYGDRIGDDCGKGQGKEGGEAIGGGGSSKEGLKEEQDVKGSYSTKIVAVVQGLKRLPDGEKAIVFSEWEDMLELLSHALHANGIRHVRCKGTKAISKGLSLFKQDPEVRAVLLPFKSGSNGLNVIEATHVFLIEPLLNVAVEAQAIGRVHRIGQDKPTTVHRMIVEQTVEERVHELSVKKMRALQHDGGISLEHARAAATKKETVTLEDMEALFDASSTASTDAYNDSWWAQRVQWGHGSGAEGAEGAEGASVRDRGLGADGELPVGPVIQRREALDRLLRAEAAERRQAVGGIESQEPGGMEVLYGQSVTLSVAERLRALPPVEEDMSGGKVEGGKG